MKLNIKYTNKIKSLKEAFAEAFPYLKIEFFTKFHTPGEPSSKSNMVNDNLELGEIAGILKEGNLTVKPEMTVAALEQQFSKTFGLPVQVFRKQNNVWIETTRTDHLTLTEQNEKGKVASTPRAPSKPADRYLEDGKY